MKDFDELVRGRKREEFKLGGQTFHIRARLHSRRFAKMLTIVQSIEGAEEAVDALVKFMDKVLLPEDRERFEALLAGGEDDASEEEDAVTLEQVNALIEWIVEHYTGKQLTPAELSTPGPAPTGKERNVVSFSKSKNQAS